MRRSTTERVRAQGGGFTVSELDRREATWRDAQPLVVRCAVEGCGWSLDAPAGDARAAAAAHRAERHPGRRARTRKEIRASLAR